MKSGRVGVGFFLTQQCLPLILRESCLTFNSLSKRNCVHLKMLMSAEATTAMRTGRAAHESPCLRLRVSLSVRIKVHTTSVLFF